MQYFAATAARPTFVYIPDELPSVAIQMEYTLALPPISC